MGALLISKNDLSATEPSLALWIEEAVARVVARRPATFRASIERDHGAIDIRIVIEERRGGQPCPVREVRLDPRSSSDEIRNRIERTMS